MGGGVCFGSQSVMVGKAQQADLTEVCMAVVCLLGTEPEVREAG